jgi:hypothetical protein
LQQFVFITIIVSTLKEMEGGLSSDDTAWYLLNTDADGAIFKGSEGIL